MSRPSIVKGTYLTVAVESDTPGTFTILCGLTTRSFTYQKNTSDDFIKDCADPEDIPVRVLNVTGRQWDLSGSGRHNRAQAALLRTLMEESSSRNFRFVISEKAGDDIDDGYWEGPAQLTNLQIGGEDSGYASSQIAIASDGEWAWTDA